MIFINPYVNAGGGGYSFEQALRFDGTNDFCNMPIANNASKFTVSFWVRLNSSLVNQPILSNTASNGVVAMFTNSTTFIFNVGEASAFTIPTTSLFTWYNLVITYDRPNLRLYLNGVQSTTGEQSKGTINLSLLNMLGRQGTLARYINGDLDDLVIWEGITASQTDVTDIYNGGLGVDPTTVISSPNRRYKFNGNANDDGSDADDVTLNNFIANPYVAH